MVVVGALDAVLHGEATRKAECGMLRLIRRELETERWDRLRHRHMAKAVGNSDSSIPKAAAPALGPTTDGFDMVELKEAKTLLDQLKE